MSDTLPTKLVNGALVNDYDAMSLKELILYAEHRGILADGVRVENVRALFALDQ